MNVGFIAIVGLGILTLACNSSKTATDDVSLVKNHWVLVEINDRPLIHAGTNNLAFLEFTAEGNKVTGSTGCNRLFGTFTLTGDEKIEFSGIGSTKMACPDMGTENDFLNVLESTNGYGISGKELLLKKGDTLLARLRAEQQ